MLAAPADHQEMPMHKIQNWRDKVSSIKKYKETENRAETQVKGGKSENLRTPTKQHIMPTTSIITCTWLQAVWK